MNMDNLNLFDKLRKKRLEQIEVLNDDEIIGVWKSIIDKYPDSAHFVYELLQNADDTNATEVTIILYKTELIFKHNGAIRFSISDTSVKPKDKNYGHINSITGIGASSKNDGTNKIGKFGVGFKSVFQYTKTPEIFDDEFKFAINNYIVPRILDYDHEHRKEGETLFRLPFTNPEKSYEEIRKKLLGLDNPILFLRHLKKITWWDATDEQHHEYSKEVRQTKSSEGIDYELITLNNCGSRQSLWLFTKDIWIEENDSKSNHKISVGYYLTEDEKNIDVESRPKVFCFFPTSESFGLCCVCHAPFLLTDNRQQFKPNEDVNKYLVKQLAELAADALPLLCEIGRENGNYILNENLFKIVPSKNGYNSQSIISQNEIYNPFLNIIKSNKILFSNSRNYIGTKNALIPMPRELAEFVTKEQLNELLNDSDSDFISVQSLPQDLKNDLGMQEFNTYRLVIKLTAEFMNNQPMEWVLRLYSFLRENAKNYYQEDNNYPEKYLRYDVPIIKTMSGEWVAPYKKHETGEIPNVYLPLENINDGNGKCNFVAREYADDKQSKSFMDALGIRRPEEKDYIFDSILSKYTSNCEIDDKIIIEDFDIIYSYWKKLPSDEQETYTESLKRHSFLVSKNIHDANDVCKKKAEDIYDDTSELKDFFSCGKNDVYFFDYDFYDSVVQKNSRDSISKFIQKIGVARFPRISQNNPEYNELMQEQEDIIKEKERKKNILWTKIIDYQMIGLQDVLSNITKERSLLIWETLHNSDINDKKEMLYEYNYCNYYNKGKICGGRDDCLECDKKPITENIYEIPSSLTILLKNQKWLFTPDNNLLDTSSINVEDLHNAGYEYDKDLIDFLGIGFQRKNNTLKDLGATEEQQQVYKRGQMFNSDEDAQRAKELLEEEKRKEEQREQQERQYASLPKRKDLIKVTEDEMFRYNNEPIENPSTPEPEKTTEEKIEEIRQEQENEAKKQIKREQLLEETKQLPRYTYKWFKNMLDLEYSGETQDIDAISSKAINISFGKVEKEAGSERIYVLRNPSHSIPLQLEDIGGLEIKFVFSNQDEIPFEFEVASVRDYTLRVKANTSDMDKLNNIDWNRCTRATISSNDPIELMKKLNDAFKELKFEDNFSMKDNLRKNVSFVFGPPGTGKTTHIAARISELMNRNENLKVLVLAPTNKACDVLTNKLIDTNDNALWLARFVATGDEKIEKAGYLVDRNSEIVLGQCCVVSTIARLPYDGFKISGIEFKLSKIKWDYIFIDEASMIPLGQIAYAIYRFEGCPIIISGDPLQIAPIVREQLWKDENIYTMVNLTTFDHPKTEPIDFDITFLKTQYRSIPSIGKLFSEFAYNGLLQHYRTEESQKKLSFENIVFGPINYIQFLVQRYDSMFGIKKLSGSPVHIYSVLLVVEFAKKLAQKFKETHNTDEKLSVGIICPYKAEAQFINRLLEQTKIPEQVTITTGTVHGFQGDECDAIIAVFNPPTGLKKTADQTHLNNKNIINVAVSRARDYLFVFLPHKDMDDYDKLREINRLGSLSKGWKSWTCDELEKVMFGRSQFIEQQTFVTSHQMTNVYSQADYRYEIHIDENSVDVQIGPKEM